MVSINNSNSFGTILIIIIATIIILLLPPKCLGNTFG